MRYIFLSFLASSMLLTGCKGKTSTDKQYNHKVLSTQEVLKFDNAQEAYEAEDFHSMLELISTQGDTYGLNKHFVPSVGRDKEEFSEGKWKHQELCPIERDIKVNAIDKVALEAANSRLVIINEAHDSPQHREFILQLLPHLAKQGFSVYAAETFSLGNMDINQWNERIALHGASAVDGFYSKEPTFSRLISKAHELDFQFVPYEYQNPNPTVQSDLSIKERIRMREEGQAKNLWERVLKDSNKKVVVHVGYGHVVEEVDKFGNYWFAAVLKNTYGIDPLTISQTNCPTRMHDENWTYSNPSSKEGVDINVHSMEEVLKNKRPIWFDLFSYRRLSSKKLVKGKFESVIIEAINLKDDRIAERVFFKFGEEIDLVLPPGDYEFILTYNDGQIDKIQSRSIK